MISRRAKRSAVPQETLRQFALNTSKGIDCTKAPTSSDTVASMVNLVVNPDGSVSPRKPIVQNTRYTGAQFVKTLYLDNTVLALGTLNTFDDNRLCILEDGVVVPFTLRYTDYIHTQHDCANVEGLPIDIIQFYENTVDRGVQVINTVNSSVVGNVAIALDYFIKDFDASYTSHTNPALFDDDVFDKSFKVARYLKFYKKENVWYLEVMTPEINTLTTAEGVPSLNPNTALDNPYAVRDVYGTTAPRASGILAYGYSRGTDNGVVSETYPSLPTENRITVTKNIHGVFLEREQFSLDFSYQTISSKRTEFLDSGSLPNLQVTAEAYMRSAIFPSDYRGGIPTWSGDPQLVLSSSDSDSYPLVFGATVRISDPAYTVERISIKSVRFKLAHRSDLTDTNLELTDWQRELIESYKIPYTVSLDSSKNVTTISNREDNSVTQLQFDTEGTSLDSAEYRLEATQTNNNAPLLFMTDDIEYSIDIEASIMYKTHALALPDSVQELTESSKNTAFRITSAQPVHNPVILKAFCAFPNAETNLVYASWTKSSDGVNWDDCTANYANTVTVVDAEYRPDYETTITESKTKASYTVRNFVKFSAASEQDALYDFDSAYNLIKRPDILPVESSGTSVQYRFRVCLLKRISEDDPLHSDYPDYYKVELEYSTSVYNLQTAQTPEYVDYTFDNTVLGKKLMYKKSLYSYGVEKFSNNIFVTTIDNLITPLYNIIDTSTSGATLVTGLVPWRDYLISFTPQTTCLHSSTDVGYLTKIISTTVGVPTQFSKCCRPVLNGVVLVSGSRVYFMYPNQYADNDTVLNLTDISTPIEDVLTNLDSNPYECFSFVTSTEYVLMVPTDSPKPSTLCVRYNFTDRTWTTSTYPELFYDFKIHRFDDIRIYSSSNNTVREFKFDCDIYEHAYGDVIDGVSVPIEFEWDTGQKTDSIAQTKQFVESKLMFATDDALETFPMELTIAIDGDPHIIHKDINTDSPFWNSDDLETKGTLGTSFRLGNEGLGYSDKGVLRQLVVRYSGKGRSIRHILKGRTHSKFKLYETYVRYKTLNVKR